MQSINIRHQLHLHRRQVVVILLLCFGFFGRAQNNPTEHLADYDNQVIHYGFLLALHSSSYNTLYDDVYASLPLDTLHSVIPTNTGGFKLGFVVNFHLLQYLDFRILPTVGFYQNTMRYRLTDGSEINEILDPTMVEFPMLLKYKSQRRGNYAFYVVGGVNPQFEAVGKDDQEQSRERLDLKTWNVALEVGVGVDMFFPLFKFSPEIRYSHGLRNMLRTDSNSSFNVPLRQVTTHNIALFITFEGGPSTNKKTLRSGMSRRDRPRKMRKKQ